MAALGFVLLLALAGVGAAARPAGAVQTNTFSLTPTGERTSIVVTADQGPDTDHFVLHNLTGKPISIAVQVLSLTKSGGAFRSGPPGVGFSRNVTLPMSSVQLTGGQTRTLPVRIDTDYQGTGEHFAVIDAHQVTKLGAGLNVVAHLQLAIELKPAAASGASGASSGSAGSDVWIGVAAGLILLALLSLLVTGVRRRRALSLLR